MQTNIPIWIIINDNNGEIFEGHQGHFRDCFFTNGTESEIKNFCESEGYSCIIRPMTEEELIKYPEAMAFML